MSKDINIHVKTQGTEQAKQELNQVAQATEGMGAKTSRAAGWIKEAFTALVGPLGIAAVVALVVAGISKIIAAFDDMRRASAEAVQELANQQRAAASFFEAVNAYTSPQRKAAMAQARHLQMTTGIPYADAMRVLESQQRTFGEINPQSSEQFAAYSKLHAGPQTGDLISWMGESGIKTPEQQGKIMRMIAAVSEHNNLKDEEIITALKTQGERFRYLGWTPEQTIENLGKVLVPNQGTRGIQQLFGAIEKFTPDEALKMHAPPQVAASEQARWNFLKNKAAVMSPEKRSEFLNSIFGTAAPTINKLLFEPTSPDLQRAISYAATPQAAEEDAANFRKYQQTAEARGERAGAVKGFLNLTTRPKAEIDAEYRSYGESYLEWLSVNDRKLYESIKFALPEEKEKQAAAKALFLKTEREFTPPGQEPLKWEDLNPEQRLSEIRRGAEELSMQNITNNDFHTEHNINYYPTTGDRLTGPRADRDFK